MRFDMKITTMVLTVKFKTNFPTKWLRQCAKAPLLGLENIL